MATYRIHKSANYTVMSNYHLRDEKLTLRAKGLLSVMLMLPDDWRFSISGLTTLTKEGATAVRSTLNELKDAGYVKVTQSKDESGRFAYAYDVYEVPDGTKVEEPEPIEVHPQMVIPGLDEQAADTGEHPANLDEQVENEPEKKVDEARERQITEAIEYLNERAGTSYRPNSDSHRKLVRARLRDGYTPEQIRAVIDKKCDQWLGTDNEMYLRPSTLFRPSKFDEYLNQPDRRRDVQDDGWGW